MMRLKQLLKCHYIIFLMSNVVTSRKVSTSYKVDVEVPAFKLNGHVVWGATAMILSEIKDLLKQLL